MKTSMSAETKAILPISIIIPTYCEEIELPKLLVSIDKQVFRPFEVIVADAFSKDKTREIALKYGCKVVDGGAIAKGRNAGAKVAKSEYLLFMDADTQFPSPFTLAEAFFRFLKDDVDIASAKFRAPKKDKLSFGSLIGGTVFKIWNFVRGVQTVTSTVFTDGGAFVLVRKSVFEHLGGYNEKIRLSEDSDFFRRANRLGYKYANLPVLIETSVRRYDSPEKIAKMLPLVVLWPIAIGLSFYAGSSILKKLGKYYGRLGGGAGRGIADDD